MYDLSPQPSTSLEDVIGNMKDTLKAIRNDVNHKTLKDLNREMTPFDLPALSPVPQVESFNHMYCLESCRKIVFSQKAVERRPSTYSVGEEMKKDRVEAIRSGSLSFENFLFLPTHLHFTPIPLHQYTFLHHQRAAD